METRVFALTLALAAAVLALPAASRGSGGSPLASHSGASFQDTAVPNDIYFDQYQWNLRQIHAPEAWALATGSSEVIIAILDTGIALDHPDLASKIVPGWDFVNGGPLPSDDSGHGTHVAGVAAAASDNGVGITGLCWKCRIMPVKVLDRTGTGDASVVAAGLRWAVDTGAKIINLSITGYDYSQDMAEAITYAYQKGALVVSAVGNDGANVASYPASYEHVLAVGATDEQDLRASFSNYGDFVNVVAPGNNIPSTYRDPISGNIYAIGGSTASAVPHVSGLAGLIWSINPALTNDEVQAVIERTADRAPGVNRNSDTGWGRINAYRAVVLAAPWNYYTRGAGSYSAPASGSGRLFLPVVTRRWNDWSSSIFLQNTSPDTGNGTITFYDNSGATVGQQKLSVAPFGSWSFFALQSPDLPNGYVGSALVDSSASLVGVVNLERPGEDRMSFSAVKLGENRLAVPLVFRESRGWNTEFYLQNLFELPTELAISLMETSASSPTVVEKLSLALRGSISYSFGKDTRLPAGLVGTATVESLNPGSVAGVVAQVNISGAAMSCGMPTVGYTSLAVPLLFKHHGGWNSGVQVQNLGAASATVAVLYSRSNGPGGPWLDNLAIPPKASATLYLPAVAQLPDDFMGSAMLSSLSGQPLAAYVNLTDARGFASCYEAVGEGDIQVFAPLIMKDYAGWNTGIQVQNLGTAPAQVSVEYYDKNGNKLQVQVDTIPVSGSRSYYQPDSSQLTPGFIGSAIVRSINGQRIAAIVNQVKAGNWP